MDFRTIVPISKTTESITYYTSIVSLGSCFAVNMAQKFAYYKFPITVNPFGVLFHPLAIENILQHTIENSRYTAEEITESISHIIALLKQLNPSITVVFTISPVRHIKDGFFENQVSKSQLFAALYPLITDNKSLYFPAYELLLDELRDYRFYANDMVHPSEMAINYIWERLVATYIDSATQADMKQVDSIQKGLSHRPFNPETESHQQFLAQLQQKMEAFTMKYPHIRF